MQAAAALAVARAPVVRAPTGPACFAFGRRVARAPRPVSGVRLTDGAAEALAELLPLLLCGEESAVLAFGARAARDSLDAAACARLERIRREEVVHGLLLQRLQTALPATVLEPSLRTRMRRFFIMLTDRDPGRYFARIAGLDSAVCIVLGALRGRRSPLGGDAAVAATFARIHRDEARHVDAARGIALAYAPASRGLDAAVETRRHLVELLRARGGAFERLGVDADLLFERLGTVSRGIFA